MFWKSTSHTHKTHLNKQNLDCTSSDKLLFNIFNYLTKQDLNALSRVNRFFANLFKLHPDALLKAPWLPRDYYGKVAVNQSKYLTDQINCLILLPTGQLASGSKDGTVRILNSVTGECLHTLSNGDTDRVNCLAILPNNQLASGSDANEVCIWDIKDKRLLRTLKLNQYRLNCLAVLPTGYLAAGFGDGNVYIWDSINGECLATLRGHRHLITCLAVLPNGQLASGSADHTIAIWDLTTAARLHTLVHNDDIVGLGVLPTGQLASFSEIYSDNDDFWYYCLKIWNPVTGACLQEAKRETRGAPRTIAVLPTGQLVVGLNNGHIHISRFFDGQIHSYTKIGPTSEIQSLTRLPDGQLASCSTNGTLYIWKFLVAERNRDYEKLNFPKFPVDEIRVLLTNRLNNYISRLEQHTKHGKIDFEYKEFFFKSKACNRQANYLLAKALVQKLNENVNGRMEVSQIFQSDYLSTLRQVYHPTRDIHSSELKKIIYDAQNGTVINKFKL